MKAKRITLSSLSILLFIVVLLFSTKLQSQNNCAVPKVLGLGFSASISEVSLNADFTYTVVIQVRNNGAPYDASEALNHFSVEANPGTYSDVSYALVYGDVSYNGINYGPNLGGWDKQGFRISSINGIGGGQAGIFSITFTLTEIREEGHYVMAKAGESQLIAFFSRSEFDLIMNCDVAGVYAMPAGGKISSFLNKIGPELTALSEFNGVPYSNDVYQIVYDESSGIYYVVAEFTPEAGQKMTLLNELLDNHGLREYIEGATISGQVPISELRSINELPSLQSALPVYPVTTNTGLLATSQGDKAMISDVARDVFTELLDDGTRRSINGAGVTVGVISNSYDTKPSDVNGANYDVLNFELPGVGIPQDGSDPIPNPYNETPVNVLKEYPYGQASDEGRAMMQIVHDVAPGANLYFRTGVLGAADMAAGIHDLAAYCDIIVDDVTYITEPFFENGVVADAVNSVVTDQNVKYFTSAGNFGGRSYTAEFNESTHSFEDFQGYLHDFNPEPGQEDVYQHISASVPESANLPIYYTIVLQWDDGVSSFEATQTDLDIYLVNDAGLKVIGCNKDNRGGKAIEVLPFAITEDLDANIVIAKTFGTSADVTFKYIVFKGLLENVELNSDDNSTIIGHANTAGAMTVGAIRYDKTPAYENDLPMEIMSFSSVGSPWTVNGINKPDFTAPNGVNTTVDLGNGDWDGDEDELPNFFGTSAAAPHAAALAALLLDAYKSYYFNENEPFVELTADEVRSKLSETAIKEEGYDESSVYGNGFIQADRALMLLGNPAPVLYDLTLSEAYPDSIPGLHQVDITIHGDYFTDETVLYFNGPEVAIYDFVDENTLTATIPPFTDLYPPITAENPPRTYSGKDGGMSNAIYFTEKPIIVGTFAGTTKKYGQDVPGGASLTYSVHAMGEEPQELEAVINSTTFPDEDIPGILSEIYDTELLNNADALANAGIYPYYIDPHDWLNPQYTDPDPFVQKSAAETFLLDNFSFRFDLGDLEIEKLDMTVAVDDPEVDPSYGDPISISVTFEYNTEGISPDNNTIIQSELQDAYEGDVLTDFIALVDDFTYALDANGTPIPNSYFISEDAYNAMLSANQALAMVNGKALAMVNQANEEMLNGMAIAMVNRTQALAMVNGKALAMVNLETLLNGQALAMVNTNPDILPGEGEINGLALAMVNRQALAMVNEDFSTEAFWNGHALAMVNQEALVNGKALAMVNGGLVNGQALAMVNNYTISELDDNNKLANLILTVDDIRVLMGENPDPDNLIELISVNTVSGITATSEGEPHQVAPGAFIAANFNVSYELGELNINKADLTVLADNQVINEGQPAPDYTFTEDNFEGLVYEESVADVFGSNPPPYDILSAIDSAPYDTESPPGDYELTFDEVENYNILSDIHLFVNPDGPGTKAIVPKLDCVEDNGGGLFTAHFMYDNKNDETVWVLIGDDNIVTGGGAPDLTEQPIEFVPGGGYWSADFDGSQMVWTVASQDHGHKTAKAQEASSDSRNCEGNRSVESGFEEGSEPETVLIYPNPVIDKLIIETPESEIIKGAELFNIYGTVAVVIDQEVPGNHLEIDMSGMTPGIYILNMTLNSSLKTYKIIKR